MNKLAKRHPRKFSWLLGICALALVFPSPARASILRVKAGAMGANNGSSWSNAYTDLQAALAVAKSGDEIWVAAGTYKPTYGNDRNQSFVMPDGVALYGGFAGIETETNRQQRDWKTHVTILSGDIGAQRDISDNSYTVVTGRNNAVLDGFTVTGGNSSYSYTSGGGMLNSSVSPTIANCIFSGNSSYGFGGGMCNYKSSPTVTSCTFNGNLSQEGGGMCNLTESSPVVTNCIFNGNFSYSGIGGGMSNVGG